MQRDGTLVQLTSTILVHNVDTKFEAVVLIQLEWFTFSVLWTKSPSIQECAVARLEVANVHLLRIEKGECKVFQLALILPNPSSMGQAGFETVPRLFYTLLVSDQTSAWTRLRTLESKYPLDG